MQKKIKILQVNAYYGLGSTGNIVRDIEKEGNAQGLEMYSIYWLQNQNITNQNVYYLGRMKDKSGISKICEWIFCGGKLQYNNDITEKIIHKIREIDPDIIHLHNLHGDFEYGTINIEILFEFLKEIQKRVIWTFHDCWPITGRCYHFEYRKCKKWKDGCGHCPQRMFDREGIFRDRSNKNWKRKKELYDKIENMTIVTVSNWLNCVVKESMLKKRNIVTIYNGVDTKIFKPANTKTIYDKYRILSIGWDRRKGFKDYYRLSKLLPENMEIVVVGKRPFFRKYRKLPNNIKEINRVNSKEDMARIYQSSSIYFNASPAETFGLTTVEAMACGLPVVAYNNTATTEIIKQIGGDNELVENGCIEEVKNAICHIKDKKENELFLHQKCVELFEYSTMLKKYVDLYKKEIERENGPNEICN